LLLFLLTFAMETLFSLYLSLKFPCLLLFSLNLSPIAMPKEFEPLNDWLGVIDAKKEDEREILLNLPDQPEITGGK
jgi:hypothetical protein